MTAKILVADDEPDVLFMTSFSLRSLGGYQVLEAHDGAEAVEIARRSGMVLAGRAVSGTPQMHGAAGADAKDHR